MRIYHAALLVGSRAGREVSTIFYREAGIFCLHNIYPAANAESNGLRFPVETNEIGTKTTPLSGVSLRRTDDLECGHRDKFQRNGKIVQSAQTQMLTNCQYEWSRGWKVMKRRWRNSGMLFADDKERRLFYCSARKSIGD